MASFFEESIEGTIEAIELHLHSLRVENSVSPFEGEQPGHFSSPSQAVLLVGGFGESPWLFQRLRSRLASLGLSLSRPDVPTCVFCESILICDLRGHRNKAVAQGAVAFFLDAIVTSRVSRFEYGIKTSVKYDPCNLQHAVRSSQAIFMADGVKRLPCGFTTILDEVRSQTRPVVPAL